MGGLILLLLEEKKLVHFCPSFYLPFLTLASGPKLPAETLGHCPFLSHCQGEDSLASSWCQAFSGENELLFPPLECVQRLGQKWFSLLVPRLGLSPFWFSYWVGNQARSLETGFRSNLGLQSKGSPTLQFKA